MLMSSLFSGKVVVDSSTGAVGGGCVEIGDNDGWVAHFGYSGDFSKSDSNEMATYAAHAINNHDKMAELLSQHRAFFVGMLENIPKTATFAYVEMVQGWIAQIDEVLGDE